LKWVALAVAAAAAAAVVVVVDGVDGVPCAAQKEY
jgi:hypothetical protein